MNLPKFFSLQTKNLELNRVQDNIQRTLEPLFNTPILAGNLLTKINLVAGSNIINHGLGRNLIGWQIARLRANAAIYDNQDFNPTPNLTLILVSDAPVTIDIYVY